MQVADAYYVLSDAKRRKEYDDLYGSRRPFGNTNNGFPGGFSSSNRQPPRPTDEQEQDEYDESEQHEASGNFFKSFAGMFGGAGATANEKTSEDPLHGGRPDANGVFGDVFEDMYVPPLRFPSRRLAWRRVLIRIFSFGSGQARARGGQRPSVLELRRGCSRWSDWVYRR